MDDPRIERMMQTGEPEPTKKYAVDVDVLDLPVEVEANSEESAKDIALLAVENALRSADLYHGGAELHTSDVCEIED